MNQKKLIVNADDFGQSPGINLGIMQTHEKGIVTSASLMVRYSAAAAAAEYAKRNPALGVGLHVDLGEWFYCNGTWQALYEVVDVEDSKAVEAEVNRQLEKFCKMMGRMPTHIDSHQHVHLKENIRPLFLAIAERLNITLRRFSNTVKYCGDFYGQNTDGSPYHSAISVDGLIEIISKLTDDTTELACHPGMSDDMKTMYKTERQTEVNTLCDKRIREAIDKANIQLCSFEEIGLTKNIQALARDKL